MSKAPQIFLMTPLTSSAKKVEMEIIQWYLNYTTMDTLTTAATHGRSTVKNTQDDAPWQAVELIRREWFTTAVEQAITTPDTKINGNQSPLSKAIVVADYAWYAACLYLLVNSDLLFTTGQDVVIDPGVASFQGMATALGVRHVMWRNDARVLWNQTMNPLMAINASPAISDHLIPNHMIETIVHNDNGPPQLFNNLKKLVSEGLNMTGVSLININNTVKNNPALNAAYVIGKQIVEMCCQGTKSTTPLRFAVPSSYLYLGKNMASQTLSSLLKKWNWFGLAHEKEGDTGYLSPQTMLLSNPVLQGLIQISISSIIISDNLELLPKADKNWLQSKPTRVI